MAKVLVKFEGNYADEFDVDGFAIMSENQYKVLVQRIKDQKYPVEHYFGSNEELHFECAEDILHDLWSSPITEEEAKTIAKLFGNQYGLIDPRYLGELDV